MRTGHRSDSTPSRGKAEPTTATHPHAETLLLALDLGNTTWKLGFTTDPAQALRMRTMMARDLAALAAEIDGARRRFALPPNSPVVSSNVR